MPENAANFDAQNEKAKSAIVAQVVRIVRKAGLDYAGWRYVAKQVRKECELRPAKKGRKLPRVLAAADFQKFYEAVDQAEDVQHSLMLRLLFYTGVRVSELCNILVGDVTSTPAASASTRARTPRTATSSSARASPRP